MRALLINPSTEAVGCDSHMNHECASLPTGLVYLATSLVKSGHEVRILDLIVKSTKTVSSEYNEFRPDIVGIGILFSGRFRVAIEISKLVKEIDANSKVAVGGYHATIFGKEIIDSIPTIDYVITGDGEESFVQLLNSFTDKSISVDGVVYRENGKTRINEKTKFCNDVEILPLWSTINKDDYEIPKEIWEKYWHNPKNLDLKYRWQLFTSRACYLKCNFCGSHKVHGSNMRFRSAQNCFEEMSMLYEQGVNYFSIIDDNFTANKKRVVELAELVSKSGMNIYIDTSVNGTHANNFDSEILGAMKAMGLIRIAFAIESGSEHIRNKVMGKNLSNAKIHEVSLLMKNEKDIHVRAFFIIGMPEETEETLEQTYSMAKELYIDNASVHFITPFPGTKLWEQVVGTPLLDKKISENMFMNSSLHLMSDEPIITPPNVSTGLLKEYRAKVYQIFEDRYCKLKTENKYPIHHLISL